MFRFTRNFIIAIKDNSVISDVIRRGLYGDSPKCTTINEATSLKSPSHLIPRTIVPFINPNVTPRLTILDKPITDNFGFKIDPLLPVIKKINEPSVHKVKEIIDPLLTNIIEKQCVGWNMLIIRRKKMKKHQRKKRRKRLKYLFLKRSLKRTAMKEMAFQNEILTKLKEAEKFDPAQYVQSKLDIVNKKIPPYRWRGVRLPTWVVEEALEKKRLLKADKEAQMKRRKEMLEERGTLKVE